MEITASMLVQLLQEGRLDVGGTTLTISSELEFVRKNGALVVDSDRLSESVEKLVSEIIDDELKVYKKFVIKMMADLDNFKGKHYGN